MDASEPFRTFERIASDRGFIVTPGDDGPEIWKNGGCFRIRSENGVVILEITHGPPDQPAAFWMDLFTSPPDPLPEMPTFLETIDYGLDLMGSDSQT
jgi:hypothetical protein